jgi:uncharacterized protein DUF2690/helix-turn-helix protein
MTSKWTPLPDALQPDARRLIREIRGLKDRSGLSLNALAQRTPFSKSSWERYLNGKALPPRQAVLALGHITGAEPARLTALWENAKTAWAEHDDADTAVDQPHFRNEPADNGSGGAPERPAPSLLARFRAPKLAALAVASLLACAAVGVLAARDHLPGQHDNKGIETAASTPVHQLETNCFGDSCTGKDPKQTGCAGGAWTAAVTRFHGVYVELRYSDACKAAWARISWGHPGDVAEVVPAHGSTLREKVHYDTDVYTAMTAAMTPSAARACTTPTTGGHGCTPPGGTEHLTEPPEPPAPSSPSAG